MDHNMRASQRMWFWVWLLQMTIQKVKLKEPEAQTELWRNLVVIQAGSAKEALAKAFRIGEAERGDCNGTLRLFGKPAITIFVGIEDIGLIEDGLIDGGEILWQLRRHSQTKVRAMVKSRRQLLDNLESAIQCKQAS